MDFRTLIHDPAKVQANLTELEDGRLITKKGCKIYIPSRFAERELAFVGIETQIVGIYAMTVEDKFFAVSMVCAMIRIEPTSTVRVMIDGDEYFEFDFEAGSTVMASVNLVRTDTLTYKIYNEIFAKGRVPCYLNYDKLGKLFDTAKYHADANIGQNQEVTEMIVSIIARNPANRHQYYRSVINDFNDLVINPPAFIPLRSVVYAATNTLNKLAGSYPRDGLISALVSPTTRVERIEALLRK